MNNDLISREELKKHKFTTQIRNGVAIGEIEVVSVASIDNAPTVNLEKASFMEGYNYGCDDGKRFYERPQGEWVRKEDIIHYIATQYSEHNELVPIWLSIGDLKGGAE